MLLLIRLVRNTGSSHETLRLPHKETFLTPVS
uniref:Uncharacterized protein n=1 Tax=Arundo donax TaxID=35708 RepID=A0A0A8ZFM4_ARUDO